MTMGVNGQAPRVGFMWKNQSQGFTNSDNSKIDHMKPTIEKDGNEGENVVNKKRNREVVSESEKNKTKSDQGEKNGKSEKSNHEAYISHEREKRKKMKDMFESLQKLLPQLPSKTDKATIVYEAVNQIKNLQQTLENLEKKKEERLQAGSLLGHDESSVRNSQWHSYESNEAFVIADQHGSSNNNNNNLSAPNPELPIAFKTWSTPNVVLNICGDEAHLCIYTIKKPGLLTKIAFVLENHNIDVISANISCDGNGNAYKIQAHVKQASHQFQNANSMEETYVHAGNEISKWIA